MFSLFKKRGPKCEGKTRSAFREHAYKMIAYKKVKGKENGEDRILTLAFSQCEECGVRDNFMFQGNGKFSGHISSYSSDNGTFSDELLQWREVGILPDEATNLEDRYKEYVAKLLASELTEGG